MTATATCPICSNELHLVSRGEFDVWLCSEGHGLAATLSESYEVAQEDDLRRLWQLARKAQAPSPARSCPMCAEAMVSVIAPVDPDEVDEGQPGDTPDTDHIPVDVCVTDQVIWFDTGEVERFPADLPDPQPTPEQQQALAKITEQFGAAVLEAGREPQGLTDRLANRLLRSPGPFGMLARRLGGD